VLYDSRDQVTHAMCVGMTGSGKTGLCLSLLEEAAIDGIPAIVIDPKGDLGNLLLTFPQLRGEDFAPWVNPDDAKRKGIDVDTFASQQADTWKAGLGKWNQTGERIERLKASADVDIYTPGSSAGIAVSILKSFEAPPQALRDDSEMFRERISVTATSLLGLLGIDADPIQSREHILLCSIFSQRWSAGENLDLARLIADIQQPPMKRVGVLDIDSFFSQKDRFALAMQLNNLLAAPGFAAWMEGVPLDISQLLYTDKGKPRIAIFSIAHLGDSERMFFVSLLLNQMLGWMRTQSGTTSLRALLYMDEIFGYFPPVANPPSKLPLLTMLKQARAFGVGVVLATQNPVDLDYKGLANCGTWLIGRLQTERDKQRVLEGLEGAAAGASAKFDRARMEQTLAGLGNRVFLMNNVHDDEPVIFESRWCMSYLRGPLGRMEIKKLMDEKKSLSVGAKPQANATGPLAVSRGKTSVNQHASTSRPVLPPAIKQYFIPTQSHAPADSTLIYEPYLLGTADVYFVDKKSGVDQSRVIGRLALIQESAVAVEWSKSTKVDIPEDLLRTQPQPDAAFGELPAIAAQAKTFDAWGKGFVDVVYRESTLDVMLCDEAELTSKPDESERDFRARIGLTMREQRDAVTDKLRTKYAPKLVTLQERLRKAQQAKEKESAEASSSKWTAALSVGASVLGALLGRKTISTTNMGRIGTASRTIGSTMKQSSDVARAEENVEAITQAIADLEQQLADEITHATVKLDGATVELGRVSVKPKKTDVKPRLVALVWVPSWRDTDGALTPAWQ